MKVSRAGNGQEHLKVIDSELEARRQEAANQMLLAAKDGKGWAGNQDVEYAVARIVNLMMMRVVGEQVSDALTLSDMTDWAGTRLESDTQGEGLST